MATKTKPFPAISAAQQEYLNRLRLKPTTFGGYKPFVPNMTPPSGLYDPSIDAGVSATQRGLVDTTGDFDTAVARLRSDYGIQEQGINQGADRNLQDLGTQRTYATQDHTKALADLQQAYTRTANTQRQAQLAKGVLRGGAAIQAVQKRAANQAADQAPIDTGFDRTISGLDTSVARVGQDRQQQLAALALQGALPDANNPSGGRAYQDLLTGKTRAEREAQFYGLDADAAKASQAAAAGWDPNAGRPSNQFGTGAGAYRIVVKNGIAYKVDPTGKILSQRKATH